VNPVFTVSMPFPRAIQKSGLAEDALEKPIIPKHFNQTAMQIATDDTKQSVCQFFPCHLIQ